MQPDPTVYVTDHVHSRVVCRAFAQGCNGVLSDPKNFMDGPAVVYGILRGCGEIIRRCEWIERDYYHIDHGYFLRGHYEGYYRVSKNALQCDPNEECPPDRWESLKVEMRPWRRSGESVVVLPITENMGRFLNIDTQAWLDAVVSETKKHTDRPIVVKPKGAGPLFKALDDAWCLVTHSSNAAVDAALEGIPSVVLGPSACYSISWSWKDIEAPHWPDREWWARSLAYHQFTLDEFRNGTAWGMLNEVGTRDR